jgi:anaerobic selenocysteine-containing dehydrogenase
LGDYEGLFTTLRENHEEYANSIAGLLGQSAVPRSREVYDQFADRFTTTDVTELAAAAYDLESMLVATHPEVTGRHPILEHRAELVRNPVNPEALAPLVAAGARSTGEIHRDYPLMGIIGRPSVVHFASLTHWTYTGKRMNGVRLIQIHPAAAAAAGIADGAEVVVESPRGAVSGTALLWEGIREDTIFVPNTFGPLQTKAEELGAPLYEAANVLVDDGTFDNLSGQQAYKCFACRVRNAVPAV